MTRKKYKMGKPKKIKKALKATPLPPYKKPVRVGFTCVRNEEKSIAGWIKQADYFCEEVYVIIDPDTTDKTLDIIHDLPYNVNILYQDKSLGDSDDGGLGPRRMLTMHMEQNKFVEKYIKMDEWFLSIDCDERFHPHDYYRIIRELKLAQLHGFDTLQHRRLIEPCNIDLGQLKIIQNQFYYDPKSEKNGKRAEGMFIINWPNASRPSRFQKRTKHWFHNPEPHGGYYGRLYPFVSMFGLYHFHRMKYEQILPISERDGLSSMTHMLREYDGMIPLLPCHYQMADWSDLANLTVMERGDISYPAPFGVLKNDYVEYSNKLVLRINKNFDKICGKRMEMLKSKKIFIDPKTVIQKPKL